MKYLKKYALFEGLLSKDEIEDIKNICLDLEDEGLSVDIKKGYPFDNVDYIVIYKDTEFETFTYSDVKDVVYRLNEYLGNKIECIMFYLYSGRSSFRWYYYNKKTSSIDIDKENYLDTTLSYNQDMIKTILIKLK